MRVFVLLFLILISFSSIAQELKLTLPENKDFVKSDPFFAIPNDQEQEFASIVIKNNTITALQVDKTYQVKNQLSIGYSSYSDGALVGKEFINNKYKLYFFKENDRVLNVFTFDFNSNTANTKPIEIPILKKNFLESITYGYNSCSGSESTSRNKEKFIQAFTYNTKFYLVNIVIKSSTLVLYEIDIESNVSRREIVLPDYFRNEKRKESTLHANLFLSNDAQFIVPEVTNLFPTPSSVSDHFSKMYLKNSLLTLTADKNPYFTYIVQVDLNSFEGDVTVFAKRILTNASLVTRTNSFLDDNTIYMLSTNANELYIDLWNIKERKKIKEISFNKKQDLFFEHPTIDTNLTEEDQYALLKTKKLLKNNTRGTKGISVKKVDDTFLMVIGATKALASVTDVRMDFSTSFGASFTPTMSYTDLATRNEIHAYFDTDFNFISKPVQPNIFANLGAISQNADFKKINAFFKVKDEYVYGYLNSKTGEISFYSGKK
ncbi:MAG: hypothetical protein ACI9Y7_001227 [Dokdonia sp.]|jgi:hypothetical protein